MFYCLIVRDFKPFSPKIKVIKRADFNIIIARKSPFHRLNSKRILRRFGNVFVLQKGYKNDAFLPYPTDNFVENFLSEIIKNCGNLEPVFKNEKGEFLRLILPSIEKSKTVQICTKNRTEFLLLCEDSFSLFGTEPVYLESLNNIDSKALIDLDGLYEKLKTEIISTDPLLNELDPLQLKAALSKK